jgi:hypothetical protein
LAFGRALKKPVPASWLTENAKKKKMLLDSAFAIVARLATYFE